VFADGVYRAQPCHTLVAPPSREDGWPARICLVALAWIGNAAAATSDIDRLCSPRELQPGKERADDHPEQR